MMAIKRRQVLVLLASLPVSSALVDRMVQIRAERDLRKALDKYGFGALGPKWREINR